ncbi:MAG: F0F1 ATP synthase subunit B [Patescibacteria group bacterium]|jgi:F-type H+-transporting ATPase subunit b
MGEIISTFHLDWKIIIAQLVNFAIVVWVLWFFALKPLTKTMTERTTKIEQSLKNADKIQQELQASQKEREEKLVTARKEAEQIIAAAAGIAEKQRQETLQKVKAEVGKTVELAKEQIAAEKVKMIAEVKTEIVDLVTQTTAKILGDVIDKKIDKGLIEKTLKGMTKK